MAEVRIDALSGLRTLLEDGDGGREGGDPLAEGRGQPDLFATRPAEHVRERIPIEPPGAASLLDAGPEGVRATLERWRERMRAHADATYVHVGIAERPGVEPVAELTALPFVPAAVARERERATAYRDRTQGRTLAADLLQEEVKRRERLVIVGPAGVAICPFASLAAHHVQVLPRAPRPRFEDDGPLAGATVHDALARIAAVYDGPGPIDLWVRTAPPGADAFCWRIDIVPRPQPPGVLDAGAGVADCALAPERAAAALRDAAP